MLTWQPIPTRRIDAGSEVASQNLPVQALRLRTLVMATAELESIAQDPRLRYRLHCRSQRRRLNRRFEAFDELSGN
ncbi:hypothetical protein M0R45_024470 [Rubus argutus]|uniref:Uncharacterized protein n=1 Tax=Rubus argutus TaxID=59490 RepID=A0AAW1WRM3_RUBAR